MQVAISSGEMKSLPRMLLASSYCLNCFAWSAEAVTSRVGKDINSSVLHDQRPRIQAMANKAEVTIN